MDLVSVPEEAVEIAPQPGIIYLEFPQTEAGVLDTSSRDSAVEVATVLGTGEGVTSVEKGDKVFVKSWAIDTITYNEKKYRFIHADTKGLLAIVK